MVTSVRSDSAEETNFRSRPALERRLPKRRILILMSLGWAIRNYLRSEVLDALRPHAEITVAIPYDDPDFREEFKDKVDAIEIMPPNRADRLTAPFRRLVNQAHLRRADTLGLQRRHWLASLLNTPRWKRFMYRVQDQLAKLVAWEPLFRAALAIERKLLPFFFKHSSQADLFERNQPDLVLSTFPFNAFEWPLVVEANRRNIPSVAAILSWDNLSTRGRIIGRFEGYLLWSESMRDDLVRYHILPNVPEVHITGTPQFDFHDQPDGLWGWETFCARTGLDPSRALLTYTCVPHRMVPEEYQLIPEIYDALMSANLPHPVQLLVRTHPLGDFSLFEELSRNRPHLVLSRPWQNDQQRYGWFCPSEDELALLTNTIYYSAVGFNIRSTMTLDFAIFDKPVVNIAFGPAGNARATNFIRDFYRYWYYAPVLNLKAARLAYTIEELVDHTRDYLCLPAIDGEQRAEMVRVLCGPVDGRSGKRVAEAVLKFL